MANRNDKKSSHKKEVDLAWVQKYLRDGVYPPGLSFTEKRMVRKRAQRFCFWKDELYYLRTPTDQSLGKKTRKVLLTRNERWAKVEECHVDADGNVPEFALQQFATATRKHVTKNKKKAGKMYNKTRVILERLYKNYKSELADILKDERFMWKENS